MIKIMDIKSLLIGFLLATSVMLSMGAITSKSPNNNTEIGKYQGFQGGEKLYMLNTQTGELYVYKRSDYWKKTTRGLNWISEY